MSSASAGPTGADLPGPDGPPTPPPPPGTDGVPMAPVIEDEAPIDADRQGQDGSDEVGDLDELAVAIADRDSYLDALRRLQAEFENYRKRMAKQRTDDAARASESLVDKLLPVLDTADLASSHGGGEDLAQVRAALLDALEREGLERIADAGGPFDPNVHDAVAHEPGDGDQEVAEVLRAGYRWKGRVLRPAMVKVRG